MDNKTVSNKILIGLITVITMLTAGMPEVRAADEIKLGVLSTGGDHWPRWVAWEQGYFKEQNLEVREFQTDSIAKAVQALSANSTDLMFPANTEGLITAITKRALMKIVAGDFIKALFDLTIGPEDKKGEGPTRTTMRGSNPESWATRLC